MLREFCFKHQLLHPAGAQCGHCAAELSQATGRDAVAILIGLVDDQGQAIVDLRRQLNELRHMVLDLARTHNRSIVS